MKLKFKTEESIEQFLHLNPDLLLVDVDGDFYYKDEVKNMLMFFDNNTASEDRLNVAHVTMLKLGYTKFKVVFKDTGESFKDYDCAILTYELVDLLAKWNKKKFFTAMHNNIYAISKI
jgi:hypothetical protein